MALESQGRRRGRSLAFALLLLGLAVLGLAALGLAAPALAAGTPPPTSHAVQGRENCLLCHAVGSGARTSPANHGAYADATCLGCHPVAQPTPPAAAGSGTSASSPATPTAAAAAAPGAPTPTPAPTVSPTDCLACHGKPGLTATLPSGERLSLAVDASELARSAHGGKVECAGCHAAVGGFPHSRLAAKSARERSLEQSHACEGCHVAAAAGAREGLHARALATGNQAAPSCADCHGAHDVAGARQSRLRSAQACARCHGEVYAEYARSVHGAALAGEGSVDVPVCGDCHGSHAVRDPDAAAFRLSSPEMCSRCHADEALMAKYGLSSNVLKTYYQDFHGATVALTRRQSPDRATDKAVCYDCHGVHDIRSLRRGEPAALKQRIVAGCQKCHPDAGANFPGAWLGHYELSLQRAPLAWLVRAWYVLMIPFMIGGLLLHIGVDLRRWAGGRHGPSGPAGRETAPGDAAGSGDASGNATGGGA